MVLLAKDVDLIAVFDTETTGVDVTEARIVTAFLGLMNRSGEMVEKQSWLINPGVEIPQGAIDVHGVSNEKAKAEGMDPKQAVYEMLGAIQSFTLNAPLVAYNAAFDLSLLKNEAGRYGFGWNFTAPVVDPFIMDKQVDKFRKGKRTLTVTSAHYGIDIGENAHDAEADCVAAGKLAFMMLGGSLLGGLTLPYIHERQIVYAAEQAKGLQAYFRKKDPSAIVDGLWPVR